MRLVGELPAERADRAAACLGFEIDEQYEEPVDPPEEPDEPTAPHEPPPPESTPLEAPSVPFWRLLHMTFVDVPEQEVGAVGEREVVLTRADLESPGCSVFATPRAPSLTPWHRLWPVLRSSLQVPTSGNELDVDATRRAIERGEVMQRVPRRLRSAWASRVSVWIDRSPRLVPFWSDQSEVYERVSRVCGKAGTKKRVLDDRAHARAAIRGDMLARFRADANCPVLVLGDLGIYGTPQEQVVWRRTARRLRRAGVHVAALVPCPRARFEPVARVWSAEPWERGPRAMGGGRAGDWSERALSLLRLASAALLIQPGLLRSLRRLLPAACADASTEADAWNHPHVQQADGTAMELHPEAAARLRAELPVSLQAQVTETIVRWHAQLPQELRNAETLAWHVLGVRSKAAGALTDALDFAKRLEGSMRRGHGDRLAGALQQHGMWLADVMPAVAFDRVSALQTIRALAFQGVPGTRFSNDLDPATFYGGLPTFDPGWWAVRQVGDALVLSPSTEAWPSAHQGPGSPVAWLLAARREVWWRRGSDTEQTQLILGRDAVIPLRQGELVEIHTDRCTVRISPWCPEPWAVEAGRDGFGLWADAEVNGVVQRFRWIPPGRFMMGSPESEDGRFENEGPQRQVTWTTGRWIADTPVTQEFWEKVMGSNPSKFVSPRSPVEHVSWYDSVEFVARLCQSVPGLNARLPSEAEWEYACRAGTVTATWLGEAISRSADVGATMDSIAWYADNTKSGVEAGDNASSAPASKRPRSAIQIGPRSVAQKSANPFGLYDTLGNVYEWCLDRKGSGDETPRGDVIDPEASQFGPSRVCRGGAWLSSARFVRAASRDASPPTERNGRTGLRLAVGNEPWSPPIQQAWHGATDRAQPATRSAVTAPPSNDRKTPQRASAARAAVTLSRPPGPMQAESVLKSQIGWDQFGSFLCLTVGGVVHRMRWIAAGAFIMGSPPDEEGRWVDEGPQHEVTLSRGFWLGETPCTQELWQAVIDFNPSHFSTSPKRPVENVTWYDCKKFLEFINKSVSGLRARFPTEAEWEYACRAGTESSTWVSDPASPGSFDAPRLDTIAWYGGNNGRRAQQQNWRRATVSQGAPPGTHVVAQKRPNPFGLYDMLGNVYEWCEDWEQRYGDAPEVDPCKVTMGSHKIIRGGSWRSRAEEIRAAHRGRCDPSFRFDDVGFRLASAQIVGQQATERGPQVGPARASGGGRRGSDEP